ncbi:glycosyltransferase family 4 protein [Enterovibrio makurazakiensis]|uniref:glycosyltransferase family 4 protein n=1 Tax=Enterovibrio makurazakiensis TaxID=2910232 RepID=UPI003D1A102E
MSNAKDDLKVLYIIQKIYPEKAGAGINLHNFLPYCANKFSHRVLALESSIDRTGIDEGLRYYRYKTKLRNRQLLTITQVLNVFSFINHLRWCDIVHFKSTPKGIFLITAIARLLGKKIVQEPTLVGHDDPNSFSNYKMGFLLNLSWKLSDAAVFISSDIRNHSREFAGFPINRGVNLDKFSHEKRNEPREKMHIGKDKIVISQIGKISDRKNQLSTIRIAKLLEEKLNTKMAVILIGPYLNDDYYQEICDTAKKLDLDIKFTGHVDNVESYLSTSDLYIFPSKDEGFGVSVIQALASGNHTFMSPVGCFNELRDLGFEGVIEGDDENWADKIFEYISGRDITYRLGNREMVESFDEEVISELTLKLYKNLQSNVK